MDLVVPIHWTVSVIFVAARFKQINTMMSHLPPVHRSAPDLDADLLAHAVCPQLRPDPAQEPRLLEIRDNLQARITEARREGWLGEIAGLEATLQAAEQKLQAMPQREFCDRLPRCGLGAIVRISLLRVDLRWVWAGLAAWTTASPTPAI